MKIDEQLLIIEKERLEMEKARDKHARNRFVIGGVIIAFATSGLSLYLDHQQSERALALERKQAERAFAISEKQMLIPMIYNSDPSDFDGRLKKIKDFLENGGLYDRNIHYLKGQQKLITEKKAEFERLEKERIALVKKAEEAKKKAQLIADEEAKKKAFLAANAAKQKAEKIKNMQYNIIGIRDRNKHGMLY